MPKLLTPLQYSPTLDELNDIRPLQTDNIVKPSIDIAVCNELVDSDKKATLGRLIRCTKQSHLLIKNSLVSTEYEGKPYTYVNQEMVLTITFSQLVREVMVHTKMAAGTILFYWCSSNYLISIKDLKSIGKHYLNFRGLSFDVYLHQPLLPALIFDVYGFY